MSNIERFDERTGIVKLEHKNEEWFVVYCQFFDLPRLYDEELGIAIAKGKTSHEALSKAVIKLTKKIIDIQNSIDDFREQIESLSRNLPRERDDEIIIAEKDLNCRWNDELQHNEYYEGKEINADIGIDKDGNVFSFVG